MIKLFNHLYIRVYIFIYINTSWKSLKMETRDQSEFNFAISFLNRLNNWFYQAGLSAYELDGDGWYYALLNIKREIFDDMKEGEQEEAQQFMKDLNGMLHTGKKKERSKLTPDIYEKLDAYECFLRLIIKKAGYKTKFAEDPRFALK